MYSIIEIFIDKYANFYKRSLSIFALFSYFGFYLYN
jgi:hypothetical protein